MKLPTATSRVPAGLTAKRYTSTGPALVVTLPLIDRLR